MALDPTEKTMCNKINNDFDKLIQPGKNAKGAINGASADMVNKLKAMVKAGSFTPGGALDAALNSFQDDVGENIPGDDLDSMERYKNFLDQCEYLQALAPISAMLGAVLGIVDTIENLVNDLDATMPEFGVGNLGSLIDKILDALPGLPGGDKISELLAAADKLLNCMSSLCAAQDPSYIGDLSDKTDELNDLYADLNVVDDPNDPSYGQFDYESLYNDAGMTASQKDAIDKVKGSINDQKDLSVTSVDDASKSIQNLTKIGDLF